jgi:hypothetical protein
MDPQATLVIGSKQHADLRNQAQVTSADFNKNGGVLNNGIVTRFMGFDIVVSERLPVITDKDSKTNTRGCWLQQVGHLPRRLAGFEDGSLPPAHPLKQPWDVNVMLSIGATRTQLGQIVQICAADTTGADITV